MVQTLAWVFGVVLTLVGILGFVPGVTTDMMLLGIFHVDMLHSIVHILSGLAALAAAWGMYSSRLYFQVFGVVYGLVAILGFVTGGALLFETNMADNLLHVVIAAVALYAGFMMKDAPVVAASSAGMGATM
ncbi:MAG: DUF4383 domain-containing protein [Minisyncoccia bacterium]